LFVIIAAFISWMLVRTFKSPEIMVLREISAADVAAIRDVLTSRPEVVNKTVVLLEVLQPNKVEVTMAEGEVNGHGSETGQLISLEKRNGKWIIVAIGEWQA
jgi:hypothetical protein